MGSFCEKCRKCIRSRWGKIITSLYECSEYDGYPPKEKCLHIYIYIAVKSVWQNNIRSFMCQNVILSCKRLWKQGFLSKKSLVRVNRSIQAEGNFAYVKEKLEFCHFLFCGNTKVIAEWVLFSLAINVLLLLYNKKPEE